MGIFIFIYILLFLSSIINRKKDRLSVILLLFMFIINLFRGINVGSDTINYYNNQFYGEAKLDFSSQYELEWIFQLVSAFIRHNDLAPQSCLYFLSIVTFLFLFLSYRRYHKQTSASLTLILVFYFVFDFYSLSFNIARQCAAVSILLYSYSFLYYDKKKFILLVILAAGFHISSLAYAFLALLRNFNINKFQTKSLILLSYIILILIFLTKVYIWDIVFTIFPSMSLYANLLRETEIGSFSPFSIVLESFRLGLGLYVFNRLKQVGLANYNTLFYISLIAVIFMDSFYGNVTRIFIGISIIRVISYSALFSRKKLTKTDKIVFYTTIIFYGIFILAGLNNGAYEIVPYEFDL